MAERVPLATSQEVADYLGISIHTLNDWAYRKIGPKYSYTQGSHGKRRYRWSDVDEYVEQQTAAATKR